MVVEIYEQLIRATLFRANFDRKKINLIRSYALPIKSFSQPELFEQLQKVLKNFRQLGSYKIIVSLDSTLATTMHAAVVLVRDQPKQVIDDSDLDNRIAQGIWRLFDRQRGQAATKMAIGDLDIMLTDIMVKQLRLDGSKVINPIGFNAKTVEIQFLQTFSPKDFAAGVKNIIPTEQMVLMAEHGVLQAEILAKTSGANFLLVDIGLERANVFISEGSMIAHANVFDWGRNNLLGALVNFLGVNQEIAEKIMGLYLNKRASPAVLKKIERILAEESKVLFVKLNQLLSKHDLGSIYMMCRWDLPDFIFGSEARRQLNQHTKIFPVDHPFIMEQLGFEIKNSADESFNIYYPISALLGFYFAPQDDKINKIAKRHASWLIGV